MKTVTNKYLLIIYLRICIVTAVAEVKYRTIRPCALIIFANNIFQ